MHRFAPGCTQSVLHDQGLARGSANIRAMLAYFDCFSGISGDMTLGALVDAGLSLETLRDELSRLDLGGYELEARQREDQGIQGIELTVALQSVEQPTRRLPEIVRLLDASRLERAIAERA